MIGLMLWCFDFVPCFLCGFGSLVFWKFGFFELLTWTGLGD